MLRAVTLMEGKRKAEQEVEDDTDALKKLKQDELDNDSSESDWSVHTQDLVDLLK